MDNNDRLIRLRYALDIKDSDMVKIFKLGDMILTVDEVKKLLIKTKPSSTADEKENNTGCTNRVLESFLNGFIIWKRGPQELKPGQVAKPSYTITGIDSVNNVLLKKLKIALTLTTEDMIDIFSSAGITVTKGELGALLRKEGHKKYVVCGNKYARNFLKGLAIRYRDK